MFVIVLSIQVLYILSIHKPFKTCKRSTELRAHCVVRVSFLSKLGWKELVTCLKLLQKSLYLRDYWTKSNGVFAKMQIISYCFIILKHSNVIDVESPIVVFWTIGIGQRYSCWYKVDRDDEVFAFDHTKLLCIMWPKVPPPPPPPHCR